MCTDSKRAQRMNQRRETGFKRALYSQRFARASSFIPGWSAGDNCQKRPIRDHHLRLYAPVPARLPLVHIIATPSSVRSTNQRLRNRLEAWCIAWVRRSNNVRRHPFGQFSTPKGFPRIFASRARNRFKGLRAHAPGGISHNFWLIPRQPRSDLTRRLSSL